MRKSSLRDGSHRIAVMLAMVGIIVGLAGCAEKESSLPTSEPETTGQTSEETSDGIGDDTTQTNDSIEVLNDHAFRWQGFTFSFERHTLTVSGEGDFNYDPYNNLVTVISDAFGEDNSYTPIEKLVIEDGMTSVDYSMFNHLGHVTEIELPGTLKTIGRTSFDHCAITEIVIPEGVEEIGDSAFWAIETLQRVYLPNSIKKIGENAFECAGSEYELTIYAEKGSYGETYAAENGYRFEAIDTGDSGADDTTNTEAAQ